MNLNGKKLYRKTSDKMIAGVCSGVAEYLNMDANVVRLLFVAAAFLASAGFWLYIIAMFIVPEEPVMYDGSQYWQGDAKNTQDTDQNGQDGDPTRL
ncbi:MAG: PspC domain-containing protein [Oscillospiraceae bacterium]|jgi:phage shock protein PspC (stress-responsive transcriptional regulator)|nr:PspC domain-containing protein [Oscillospiraceae bacterium]